MGVTWIIFGIVTFIYCYYWYRRPRTSPPGPRGIPMLGVIPFLGKHPEQKIYKWSKTYGPIMSVRFGAKDQVVLNNYDVIMQTLVKQSSSFSGRPHIPLFEQISQGHGLVFIDYGEKWKSQRKFGLMTLRGFGVGKKSMENQIIEEVAYLNDSIRSENGKAFDISILLKNAVSNNICSLVMGRRFEYDDLRFQEIMKAIIEIFSDPIMSLVARLTIMAPWLMYIPPFSYYNNCFMNNIRKTLKLLGEIIKEHEDTYDGEELRDFIDAFIKEKNKNEDPYFTNIQLIQYVRDLFVAGTETTSSTLGWCLLCCLHYPQTQSKLREEIMKVIGPNGTINMSHKNQMPYTNAFMQELYRFRTLARLNLPHVANEDSNIGGFSIGKGTTILCNFWAVHNNTDVFDEPGKFKPERFLDEKGNFVPSNHVIPFSVGPRHCLGEQLARMEVYIFLVGMVQKFEFLPDPAADQLPDIENGSNGQVFVPIPYKIVAKQL